VHGSIEEFAVRTQTYELQNLQIGLAIDQQEIRLKVAFPMVTPVAAQSMIAISFGYRFVIH